LAHLSLAVADRRPSRRLYQIRLNDDGGQDERAVRQRWPGRVPPLGTPTATRSRSSGRS